MALIGNSRQPNRAPMSSAAAAPQDTPADKVERGQQEKVIFGDHLHAEVPNYPSDAETALHFSGKDGTGKQVKVPISKKILSRHMMLLGGIGTGKTNAFFQIISQLCTTMTQEDVMIIFDTKGDFLKEFYTPGDVVISNSSTAMGADGQADYWNIFNEIGGEDEEANISEISKALFREACEKTSQVFFPNAARDIFASIMTHFVRSARRDGNTQFLNNESLIDFVKSKPSSYLRQMLNSYDDMRALTSYIYSDDSPQTQGVLSEMQQVIGDIFVGNFAKKGTLGLRDLVRKKGGRRIFIEYDLSYGELLTPIYSLMFDMAIKETLGRSNQEGDAPRGNVYFVADEFRLLPNLEHIDDAVNFGRSLGVRFMIGIQNVEQIYENYGEQRARSILSGFMISLNFRVNNYTSREYIKEQFGTNRKLMAYSTNVQVKGTVEESRDGYVVEDWDITGLDVGQAIIGLPEEEPFLFHFDLYPEKNK